MANFYFKSTSLTNFTFAVVILFALAAHCKAYVNLNEKWTQNTNGLWSLSITPSGTFDALISKSATCYDPGLGGKCIGRWIISVNGGAGSTYKVCSPTLEFSKGSSYGSALSNMQSKTIGVKCTLSNFQVNGNEKICIYSSASGVWRDGSTYYSLGIPFYGDSYPCNSGSGGGGVEPPIKPASCSIENIFFDHGSVISGELNGKNSSLQQTVECTQKSTVRIRIQNDGKIKLNTDGSLYSVISIDGNDGEATMVIDNTKKIDFTSTLHYTGNDSLTGVFNNASVLYLDIQ
ncbi:hypothetical protein [uncultured Erwinia sp.]|uniref:MrpH family fimbial adhesin n=1 Tax=uncultured Erwinia sp. TaxID=246798 RepID=UPI0025877D2D|nr:hypothetical protein [uncultured Erwinia sp.]